MELTKPEDIKFVYCWHCLHYTGLCPHCDGNACSCFCQGNSIEEFKDLSQEEMPCKKSKYWEALEKAEQMGLEPTVISREEIDKRLGGLFNWLSSLTPEQKEKNEAPLQDGLLEEDDYWYITKAAREINYSIPSLEEFATSVGVKPTYNCNTGKGFTEERDIPILNPSGWQSLQGYENERIPWFEYCIRREKSECDYRQHRHKDSFGRITISKVPLELKARVLSGIFKSRIFTLKAKNGKTCTVKFEDTQETLEINSYEDSILITTEELQKKEREEKFKQYLDEKNSNKETK